MKSDLAEPNTDQCYKGCKSRIFSLKIGQNGPILESSIFFEKTVVSDVFGGADHEFGNKKSFGSHIQVKN